MNTLPDLESGNSAPSVLTLADFAMYSLLGSSFAFVISCAILDKQNVYACLF